MISKTLSTSVCYARLFDEAPDLAEFAQSLYPLLVAHADDFGREQGDVLTVKYRIHPRSPRTQDEFEQAMKALHVVGLIVWYERNGRQCYQIAKFDEHQTGLHKRTRSAFPSIPGNSGNVPESPAQLKRRELKRTELNGTEQKGTEGPRAPATVIAQKRLERSPQIGLSGRCHLHDPATRAACDRGGICVPEYLSTQWRAQCGELDPDATIRAFVATVLASTPAGPVGDPMKFWGDQWDAAYRTVRPQAARSSKTGATIAAANEYLASQIGVKK